jgi:hypothetical protein
MSKPTACATFNMGNKGSSAQPKPIKSQMDLTKLVNAGQFAEVRKQLRNGARADAVALETAARYDHEIRRDGETYMFALLLPYMKAAVDLQYLLDSLFDKEHHVATKMLVDKGIVKGDEILSRDPYLVTPLSLAADYDDARAIEIFLEGGRAKPEAHDYYALRTALGDNRVRASKVLLQHALEHDPNVVFYLLQNYEAAAKNGLLRLVHDEAQSEDTPTLFPKVAEAAMRLADDEYLRRLVQVPGVPAKALRGLLRHAVKSLEINAVSEIIQTQALKDAHYNDTSAGVMKTMVARLLRDASMPLKQKTLLVTDALFVLVTLASMDTFSDVERDSFANVAGTCCAWLNANNALYDLDLMLGAGKFDRFRSKYVEDDLVKPVIHFVLQWAAKNRIAMPFGGGRSSDTRT